MLNHPTMSTAFINFFFKSVPAWDVAVESGFAYKHAKISSHYEHSFYQYQLGILSDELGLFMLELS